MSLFRITLTVIKFPSSLLSGLAFVFNRVNTVDYVGEWLNRWNLVAIKCLVNLNHTRPTFPLTRTLLSWKTQLRPHHLLHSQFLNLENACCRLTFHRGSFSTIDKRIKRGYFSRHNKFRIILPERSAFFPDGKCLTREGLKKCVHWKWLK